MASDLISRSTLLAEYDRVHVGEPGGARTLIAEAPTVDAVEVVRCKDCDFFWEYTEEHKATVENADGDCAIRKWRSDDEQFCAVTKDDYCSLARRKKDAVD